MKLELKVEGPSLSYWFDLEKPWTAGKKMTTGQFDIVSLSCIACFETVLSSYQSHYLSFVQCKNHCS